MKKKKKRIFTFFSFSRIWRLKFSTNDKWYMIYHLSIRFSSRSFFFFVKNPFPTLPYTMFRFYPWIPCYSQRIRTSITPCNLGCLTPFFFPHMNASQCRDPTALNRALGMSTFSMLRSRDVGLISLFAFSTELEMYSWDQVGIASVLLLFCFFFFLFLFPFPVFT